MNKVKVVLNDGTQIIASFELFNLMSLEDIRNQFGNRRVINIDFFDEDSK